MRAASQADEPDDSHDSGVSGTNRDQKTRFMKFQGRFGYMAFAMPDRPFTYQEKEADTIWNTIFTITTAARSTTPT